MPIFLDLDDLLIAATAILGHPPEVRDYGLLESAVARPVTTVLGDDAYPTIVEKGAALLVAVVNHHALVDGNKRLGWLALNIFFGLNQVPFDPDLDHAYDLVMAIANGDDEISAVAPVLAQ